jgi:chromosome partitioning protein
VGRVLAVVSQKGGVGKTTTAVNLAAAFARRGTRTLLIDVDPQGSVGFGLGLAHVQRMGGFADFVAGRRALNQIVHGTILPRLEVVLVGSVTEGPSHGEYVRRAADGDAVPRLLAAASKRADLVVVDTPPGLGSVVRCVLAASHHVIVPLQCEPLALQTTPQILRGLQDVIAANPAMTLDGILMTMYDEGNPVSARVNDYVRAHLPRGMVFDVVVPRTFAAIDSFAAGQPLVLRDPADPAAKAYLDLATLLLTERYT